MLVCISGCQMLSFCGQIHRIASTHPYPFRSPQEPYSSCSTTIILVEIVTGKVVYQAPGGPSGVIYAHTIAHVRKTSFLQLELSFYEYLPTERKKLQELRIFALGKL